MILEEPTFRSLRERGYGTTFEEKDPFEGRKQLKTDETSVGIAPHLVHVMGLFYMAINQYCTATTSVLFDEKPRSGKSHDIIMKNHKLKKSIVAVVKMFLQELNLKNTYRITIDGECGPSGEISICAVLAALWESLKTWEHPEGSNETGSVWSSKENFLEFLLSLDFAVKRKKKALRATLYGTDTFDMAKRKLDHYEFFDVYDFIFVKTNLHRHSFKNPCRIFTTYDNNCWRQYEPLKPSDGLMGLVMRSVSDERHFSGRTFPIEDDCHAAFFDVTTNHTCSLVQGVEQQSGGILIRLKKSHFLTKNDWLIKISDCLASVLRTYLREIEFECLSLGQASRQWNNTRLFDMRQIIRVTLGAQQIPVSLNDGVARTHSELPGYTIRQSQIDAFKDCRNLTIRRKKGVPPDTVGVAAHIVPVAGFFYMAVNAYCTVTCSSLWSDDDDSNCPNIIEMEDHFEKERTIEVIRKFLELLKVDGGYKFTIKGECNYSGRISQLSVLIAVWISLRGWEFDREHCTDEKSHTLDNYIIDEEDERGWGKYDMLENAVRAVCSGMERKNEAFMATMFGTESHFHFKTSIGAGNSFVQRNGRFLEKYDIVYLRTNLHHPEIAPVNCFSDNNYGIEDYVLHEAIQHKKMDITDGHLKAIMETVSTFRREREVRTRIEEECFEMIREVSSEKWFLGIDNQPSGMFILLKKQEFAPNANWLTLVAKTLVQQVRSGTLEKIEFVLLKQGARSHQLFKVPTPIQNDFNCIITMTLQKESPAGTKRPSDATLESRKKLRVE